MKDYGTLLEATGLTDMQICTILTGWPAIPSRPCCVAKSSRRPLRASRRPSPPRLAAPSRLQM